MCLPEFFSGGIKFVVRKNALVSYLGWEGWVPFSQEACSSKNRCFLTCLLKRMNPVN